jgi:hypothetical protein
VTRPETVTPLTRWRAPTVGTGRSDGTGHAVEEWRARSGPRDGLASPTLPPVSDEPLDPAELWAPWLRAWGLRAPLSGDVAQDIEPSFVRNLSDQLGLVNISLEGAGDPQLERRIVEDVASYGRQLGRVLDALDVVVRRGLPKNLSQDDRRAVGDLEVLRAEIEALKTKAAADRVDRLIEDIETVKQDPDTLRRLREALGED